MFVPVQDEETDGEAQRELQELGIEEARMKSDELISDYCFDATDNQMKAVYPKADVDAAIAELKDIIEKNQSAYYVDLGIVAKDCEKLKASEDVLVTDNRNLLDKEKNLENLLRENAEHFKRNESQIIENSDKVIAEKDKEIAELQKQVHDYAQGLYVIQERAEKEARHHKYKRCLAMAKWCNERHTFNETNEKRTWLHKWHKRWLELAEKFKPNKE